MKEHFKLWLSNTPKVSKSAGKYAGAISTISRELTQYTGTELDIYKIKDSFEIDKITDTYLSIEELRKKNERGKVMYTKALHWYKEYLQQDIDAGELIKESKDEYVVTYQKKRKTEFTVSEGIKQWKRDRAVVDNSIELSNHKCEYDNKHEYFISNKTEKNYVEGHHLIPMKYQDNFEYSLDVEANVVALCVVCHKILHLSRIEDKIPIISTLYNLRVKLLKLSGLEISLDELIDLYR